MITESVAIIAVILVMAFMIARSGRRVFAPFTLPLISIPVLNLIAWVLRMDSSRPYFVVGGLVLGVALCAVFSRAFVSKRGRYGYLVFCSVFMIALAGGYLINLL